MKNQIKILCGAVALMVAGHVSAAPDWTLPFPTGNGSTSYSTLTVPGAGGSVTVTGVANTGGTAAAAGTSYNTNADLTLENQKLTPWGGGLGIYNLDACGTGNCDSSEKIQPEHAIDNNQRNEMVLLQFGSSVSLTNVKFGWTDTIDGTSLERTEFTVMAYMPTNAQPSTPTLTGTWGAQAQAGWVTVGNYADVSTKINRTIIRANNSIDSSYFSSYWLIGAYNPLVANNNVSGFSFNNDSMKLASVSGNIKPPGQVPEPGSLALFGLSLLGMLAVRKRQQT